MKLPTKLNTITCMFYQLISWPHLSFWLLFNTYNFYTGILRVQNLWMKRLMTMQMNINYSKRSRTTRTVENRFYQGKYTLVIQITWALANSSICLWSINRLGFPIRLIVQLHCIQPTETLFSRCSMQIVILTLITPSKNWSRRHFYYYYYSLLKHKSCFFM